MSPTLSESMVAVATMAEVIPFFPETKLAQSLIARALMRACKERGHLEWLTEQACLRMKHWERDGGLAEIRAILGTRFPVCDGAPVARPVSEPSAEQLEHEFFEREARDTAERIEQWKREAKKLPAAERAEIAHITQPPEQLKLIPGPVVIPMPKGPGIRSKKEQAAEVEKVQDQLRLRSGN